MYRRCVEVVNECSIVLIRQRRVPEALQEIAQVEWQDAELALRAQGALKLDTTVDKLQQSLHVRSNMASR